MSRVAINERLCKQCGICAAVCPKKVLSFTVGYLPAVTDQEACIGCKLCQMSCPDFAVDVEVDA